MELAPIVHEYTVRCDPARAFEVYAGRIGEWWHPDYTADASTFRDLTIEPRVGGRVQVSHEGNEPWDLGEVTGWEPPGRLVYTSTLAQRRDQPSEITVTFTPDGDACRFRFEHGGWHEGNADDRDRFTEWPVILDRFVALAEDRAPRPH